MSYTSQSQLSKDAEFINRISACAAVEVSKTHQPEQWASDHVWWISAAPGFADAYESAILNGVTNPGRDPAVITDAQILASVQALIEELDAV